MMPEESTTPDLVQVVTGLFEAADRGDWEAVVRPYAADAVWESEDGMMSADGAHAVRALWEEWAGTFEDFRIEVESVVDLGGGVVHAVYRQQGRMTGSSALLTARGVLVYEWRDGTILRVFAWADTDETRASAERLAEERG
jgi:ketosteroid isomerase-like protein